MSPSDVKSPVETGSEEPLAPLSPAAKPVAACLAQWRVRARDCETFVRLMRSLLTGSIAATEERRVHLGSLTATEVRGLLQLATPDLSSLRSTTNARMSGVELRGPDTSLAEKYFVNLRDAIATELQQFGDDAKFPDETGLVRLDSAQRLLDELARSAELLEVMLYPRVRNPAIAVGTAIERAASARGISVSIEGERGMQLQQVRGLLRLLSEVMSAVGQHLHVYISRDGSWLELLFSSSETTCPSPTRTRAELLRFAGYLVRAQTEYREGGWRVATVAVDP